MGNAVRAWFVLPWLWVCGATAIVPSLLADPVPPEPLYDKSRALVIGIEQYPQGRSVPGAVEEAKQVAQAFRQLGFEEIIELYNKDATARRLHQVLSDLFAKKVDRSGRVVVFFGGQTGTTRDGKGRDMGYLVPADAQASTVAKFLTVDTIKEFTRRSPSKHTLFIVNAPFRAWEVQSTKPASPTAETDARVVQVIATVGRDEKSAKAGGKTPFVQTLLTGLSGAADLNQNGWLTASELGTYIKQQVEAVSLRIDGEGDTVLLEQRKAVPVIETQQRPNDREAAKNEYEQALAHLQGGKYADEALASLNRAIQHDPTFAEAYILKSYLRLEVLPQLDEALAAGQQAVKHAPDNADAFFTLGLVHEKMGHYKDAEQAFLQAAKLNPENPDPYFSLGTLYEDQLNDTTKSVEAFRHYLKLGGAHARAKAAVSQADQAVLAPQETVP
ncbi:MAG TPA: tetratricopeptide repeat protein [Nitrospira sp.]|nr:tetratricopeptide repeat protein [Nitrospira sp.]